MTRSPEFTYSALDRVAFAASRGTPTDSDSFSFVATMLGPVLELTQLAAAGLLPQPGQAPWLSVDSLQAFETAFRSERHQWVCPLTHRMGFLRTKGEWNPDETPWISFGLSAQKAAIATGFHRRIAAQFVGAIGEMVSNIFEHSGKPETGVVAFRADSGNFEFVVSDKGRGVLESLRTCEEFSSLLDNGTALRLALSEGVSRHGRGSGHGNGFRPIFVGLANLSGTLRFRSGDHALIIEGRIINAISAKTAQKVAIPGFFASVFCRNS